MKNLKQNYENACNEYLNAFCEKHELDYDNCYWIANQIGTVCSIGDFFVNMETIRIDIDSNAPVDEWMKWYDYTLRIGMIGAQYPNYDNWLRRCPIKSEEEIQAMESLRAKIESLKTELEKLCKD